MTKKTPRFKTKKFQGHKTSISKNLKKVGGAEWDLAKSYQALRGDCDSPQEFESFLVDAADGLGLSPGQAGKANRMVSALKTVPEKVIWERRGWQGGVCTIERIPKALERNDFKQEVLKRLGRSGRGKLSDKVWKELLRDHAPSLEVKDANAHENQRVAQIQQLQAEVRVLKTDLKNVCRRMPDAKQAVSDEGLELIGATRSGRRRRRTRAS